MSIVFDERSATYFVLICVEWFESVCANWTYNGIGIISGARRYAMLIRRAANAIKPEEAFLCVKLHHVTRI